MGAAFSSLLFTLKRSREADADDAAEKSQTESLDVLTNTSAPHAESPSADAVPSSFAQHLRQLRYRHQRSGAGHADLVVCRHVAEDAATQQTYGCHAHLYATPTAAESHGVALAWCVEAGAPLSSLSLLSLCRVANSCRKKTLLTSPHGDALILTYTATL